MASMREKGDKMPEPFEGKLYNNIAQTIFGKNLCTKIYISHAKKKLRVHMFLSRFFATFSEYITAD